MFAFLEFHPPPPSGNEKIPNAFKEKEQVSGKALSLRSLGLTRKAGGWKAMGKYLQTREEGDVSHLAPIHLPGQRVRRRRAGVGPGA